MDTDYRLFVPLTLFKTLQDIEHVRMIIRMADIMARTLLFPLTISDRYTTQKLPSGSDTSFHAQTFPKSLIKNWLPTPECISHSIANNYIANPHPEGSFYSIFCEKIVFIEQSRIGTLLISISAGIAGYTSHRHKLSFFAMCQSDVQQHERRDDRYHPSRLCAFAPSR